MVVQSHHPECVRYSFKHNIVTVAEALRDLKIWYNPEVSGLKVGQVKKRIKRSYDANFKMMVIKSAESANNCRGQQNMTISNVIYRNLIQQHINATI